MAEDFKILGESISEKQWRDDIDTLGKIDKAATDEAAKDLNITPDEILLITHVDKNKINKETFSNINTTLFRKNSPFYDLVQVCSKFIDNLTCNYKDMPEYLRGNKDILSSALKVSPQNIIFADHSFRADREIMARVSILDAQLFDIANQSLKSDRTYIRSLLSYNMGIVRYIDKSLLEDDSIIQSTVEKNDINVPDKNVWKDTVDQYGLRRFFSKDELKNISTMFAALERKYGINCLGRINSFKTLTEILLNRITINDTSDERPVCIFIAPKSDYNGAFSDRAAFERLIELGYKVLYFEARTEAEAKQALIEATGGSSHRKVDLIWIAGHGNKESINLGANGTNRADEEDLFIDTSDFDNIYSFSLQAFIKEGGDIVLESCSTAEGGSEDNGNLANSMSKNLPPSVRIHAATTDVTGWYIDRNKNGRIKVKWKEDSLYLKNGSAQK